MTMPGCATGSSDSCGPTPRATCAPTPRAVSNFFARNAGILADVFLGIVRGVDWLQEYQDVIQSNQDPPKTLQELMDGVGKRRPGYDDHHIIEQTAAEYWD